MANDPHSSTNFTVLRADTYLNLPSLGGGGGGEGTEETTGQTFYVCNSTTLPPGGVAGADNANVGKSPLTPFATLDYAIGQTTASRGDKIIVMPNHAESTAAVITVDMAGINIVGQGQGTTKPRITVNYAGDGITVTAANVEISGIRFPASTAVATARVNIAAANCRVHDCYFACGANDAETITITADGDEAEVFQNEFDVTANGPTSAIRIEAAGTDGTKIYGNIFNGGSQTNTWDNAAVESTVAHTNCLIDANYFIYGPSLVVATSVSTTVGPNNIYSLGTSTAAAPQVWYCDLGTTIRDGKSPDTPTTLNDALVTKATAGDTVFVLAGSTSSPTTSQAMSVAGVKLVGLGNRRNRPVITPNGTVDIIDMTGANCVVDNIAFAAATAVVTADINIGAADCVIRNCEFVAGASNTNAVITVPDAGDRSVIEGNEFLVSANGPTIAISIESASTDGVTILGNLFNGGSTTNQWDTAAINSSVAHTNCIIEGNTFLYGTAMVVATSVSTFVGSGNKYGIGAISTAAAPQVWYTDFGTTIRDGKSPDTPTTLNDALVTKATAGDTVYALAGSAVTLTASQAMSVAGVKLVGLGNRRNRPLITGNGVIDCINVTGSNCHIDNIIFDEALAAITSNINIDAADFVLSNCEMLCGGGGNTNALITLAGSSSKAIIEDCKFIVTSNGPTIAISIETTSNGVIIRNNLFDGMSATNQWDTAAINSTVAHTNCLIEGNTFRYGTAMVVATSVSTTVRNNIYGVGCSANAATPKTIYVDNGTTIRDGLSPETPTTLADAVDTLARTGIGDTILCLPGTYTLAATVTLDTAATVIKPYIDNGTFNVTFTTSADVDLVTCTAANTEISGIRFLGNAAQVTTPVLVSYATGDFNRIHDCFFDCANVASLQAITVASGSTDNSIARNRFTGQVTAVAQILDNGARTQVTDNTFSLLNTAPQAYTNVGGGTDDHQVFARNILIGDGGARATMIVPLSASAEEFAITQNWFFGTSSATPFGQNANWATQCIENYVASGAGGVLVDPVA